VSEEDLRAKRVTDSFRAFMKFQIQRVREHYDRAEPLLQVIHEDARRCTRLMGSVYYGVLERIESSGYQIFGRRIGLSFREKIGLVARTYLVDSASWVL
jgi:phytoene synthase